MRIYLLFFGIVLLSSITAAQQDPIFFADFNNCTDGDNGTCAGFTQVAGNWYVQNKEYFVINDGGGNKFISVINNFTCADCLFEVKINPTGTDQNSGIVFRYRDFSNYYILRPSTPAQVIEFIKVANGSNTQLASVYYPITPNSGFHSLKVSYFGTTFLGFYDGNLVLQASDSLFDFGKSGLINEKNPVYFDDVNLTGQLASLIEVCNDNIDNDLDSLVDCTDLYDCYGFCISNLQQTITTLQNNVSILEAQNQQLQQQINQNKGFINTLIKKVNEILCYLKLGPCIAPSVLEGKTT